MSSLNDGHNPKLAAEARHSCNAGLLLFDLDDTIVQSGSYVSQRVLDALGAAHEAGYVLSIASGRPLCIVNKSLIKQGVMDFAVCSNGACVHDLVRDVPYVQRMLSREDALDCYGLLRPFGPAWNAFFGNKAYFELKGASYMLTGRNGAIARTQRYTHPNRSLLYRGVTLATKGVRYLGRMVLGGGSRQVLSIRPHVERCGQGIEKMGCTILDEQACAQAVQLLRADGRFEVVTMGNTELEITARGVTKGSSARELMERLGIEPARSVAFGDGGNDLPLARAVGRFVAMGNADQEVKDAAFEICPSVSEDGVAVWIENMLATGGLEEGVRYV